MILMCCQLHQNLRHMVWARVECEPRPLVFTRGSLCSNAVLWVLDIDAWVPLAEILI